MPGQTRGRRGRCARQRWPFNGGPDNCPAKPSGRESPPLPQRPFNGGPDNCPAKPGTETDPALKSSTLQWRAGQLPGQTEYAVAEARSERVLQWRAGQLPGQTGRASQHVSGRESTFNGGPDNCPAKPDSISWPPCWYQYLQWRAGQLPGQTLGSAPLVRQHPPSMEGRTIARPNPAGTVTCAVTSTRPSMEGRTIARPNSVPWEPPGRALAPLQWRAGQLPGQTAPHGRLVEDPEPPSMEGRTIARPNLPGRRRWPPPGRGSFNGGPDNCPAKPARDLVIILLLWSPSMEGRTIARPNLYSVSYVLNADLFPSMEGRTIARPNYREVWVVMPRQNGLQWRAGQLPGQTLWRLWLNRPLLAFNGGPDNCPAKLERAEQVGPQALPSMEGRTIARPNGGSRARSGRRPRPFNGGPDNCPAKLALTSSSQWAGAFLQWRAGQLPGQT